MGPVQGQGPPGREQTDPAEAREARGGGRREAGPPGRAHHGEDAGVERGKDNAHLILVLGGSLSNSLSFEKCGDSS